MAAPEIGLRGLRLIQKWEGLYLKAYRDPIGIWTIGWGSINNPELGIRVYPGQVITREKAEEFLKIELREKEAGVRRLVKVPLTQYQFDTLVSFTYNCGTGTLAKSTLLKLLNQGNYAAVPAQLMRFTKAGGRELKGLVNRRRDECRLWRNEHIAEVPDTEIIRVNPNQISAKVNEDALQHTINSNTAKAGAGVTAGAGAVATQLAVTSAPLWAVGGVVVIGVLGLYIIWRKFHDIGEGR